MYSVVGTSSDGRIRMLKACARPVDGPLEPMLLAVGRISGRAPRPLVPAPRPPADDLLALALAVGVVV
jgi:hypothetical protein